MRAPIILFLALAPACIGCMGTARYTQNSEIPSELREEIHALNDTVVQSLMARDVERLLGLFLGEVSERPGFSEQARSATDEIGKSLSSNRIDVFHEFDVTFGKAGSYTWNLVSDIHDGFLLQVSAVRTHLFVSLLSVQEANTERLIALMYAREGESWRLYDLRFGLWRVAGKSAVEWTDEARRLRNEGLAIPAQLRYSVAESLLRPVPYMQYVKEGEMTRLGKTIAEDVARLPQFPLRLTDIPSKPLIYAISPMFYRGRLATVVQYVTELELSDATLGPEVEAIARQLPGELPGLCAESPVVAYRAFSESPADPAKHYTYFGIVYDCKVGAVARDDEPGDG